MTFLKKIKIVIEACCGKLDTMETEIRRQQSRISSLQTQIEEIKENQMGTTVLLEEILFVVSQSKEEAKPLSLSAPVVISTPTNLAKEEKDLIENLLVQNNHPFSVN